MESCHTLGTLSDEEAARAVRMMLEHFNSDMEGASDDWPETLARISDGWPMHLHNGMRALAAALVEANGRLADAERGRALRPGRATTVPWPTGSALVSL